MLQGRQRWQQLSELGARFAVVDAELEQLRTAATRPTGSGLDADWAAFEAEQELQQLKRRQQR
jgi:2-polyprenyl-3-methyl-5-hydroxy-6-metoxy-1,4-benzoquinol methylase